jgi:hypothetical protein
MSEQGILMTGYKEVRRTLGTVHYPYQGRPNLYDAIQTHPSLVLEQGDGGKKKKKGRAKKTITIERKRDKMEAILSDTDDNKKDGKVTEEPVKGKGEETNDNGEDIELVGSPTSMKTIRVTNVGAEKKKADLIL